MSVYATSGNTDSISHFLREPAPDADGDGVPDAEDNCPNDANPVRRTLTVTARAMCAIRMTTTTG